MQHCLWPVFVSAGARRHLVMSNEGAFSRVWNALGDFFESVGTALVRLRYWLAAWTIIPVVEGLMRIWFHLDPRVYFERLRIKKVSEGYQDQKSNKFVIFALYMKGPLPAFTSSIL